MTRIGKSDPRELQAARERYWRSDPRQRFARHANSKVRGYGRAYDVLDWSAIPAGPWTCTYCGIDCQSWDHVIPLVKGGANQPDNLTPSCVPCNQRRNPGPLVHANTAKTHCKRGHEFTEANTSIGTKGERKCRACMRAAWHARKAA